jgi:hypothetical protein
VFGHYRLERIQAPGTLDGGEHLKSAVTALPDGSIIGYPPLVDEPGSTSASFRSSRVA